MVTAVRLKPGAVPAKRVEAVRVTAVRVTVVRVTAVLGLRRVLG